LWSEQRDSLQCKEILVDLTGPASLRDHPQLQRFARSPELTFDAGLGELFVIRVAEISCHQKSPEACNTPAGIYTPLFVVLGHELRRDRRGNRHGAARHSPTLRIQLLVDCILPGLADLDPKLMPGRCSRKASKPMLLEHAPDLESPEAHSVRPKDASSSSRISRRTRTRCVGLVSNESRLTPIHPHLTS
jgi:hypothetical protein